VIVRDEAQYIAEWIEFCRLTGVERFYIYLDYPRDETESILATLNRGDIVLIHWTEDRHEAHRCPVKSVFASTPQITAFNHWIKTYATETKWVAFIDPDEYLYHAHHDDLREALKCVPFETSAVWVQWLIFGRNGHVTKPRGLTISNYTRRGRLGHPEPYGHHGKIVARSDRLAYFGPHGSHNAIFKHGGAVNEYGLLVKRGGHPAPTIPQRVVNRLAKILRIKRPYAQKPTADSWRCNHYYNRSEEEAAMKLARGDRNAVGRFVPDWQRLDVHNVNDVEDREIWRFLAALQQRMGVEVTLPKTTKGPKQMKTGLAYTQFISFEIGRVCNLAEAHRGCCPSADFNRYGRLDTSSSLSDDVIVDCIRSAYDMGFHGQIAFHYYNEPMLSWGRLKSLIARIQQEVADARFCLWTNGTILPDDISELSVFSSIWVSNYAGRDWKAILKATGSDIQVMDGRLDARKTIRQRVDNGPCVRPFNELVVDHYGNGHLCCADWRGEIHLGNVQSDGFESVVDQYLTLREQISMPTLPEDAPVLCRVCALKMRDIFELVPAVAEDAKKLLGSR
jgi:hypothetical protein